MDYVLKGIPMKKIILFTGLILIMIMQGCTTSYFYYLNSIEYSDLNYGFEVKKIGVRNINIAYIEQGNSDEVLILIHGLGTYAKGWSRNIEALSEHYRVIAVDLPGYGHSDKGYYEYTMDFNAKVLVEMLDQLKIEKATLIGHSMGSQIAITIGLNYPERVNKLVLISPAGFERFNEGEGAWMMKVMTPELVRDTPIRSVDVNLRYNFYEMPPEAEFLITERIQLRGAKDFERYCYAVSKNVEGMIKGYVYDRLSDISQPTLILWGENDQLIPNRYLHAGWTKKIAAIGEKEIPNNQTILFPECGHFVQFEKPEETNRAIIKFMINN